MEITYFGANCVRINTKKASLIVDDNLATLGAKGVAKKDEVVFVTNPNIVKISDSGVMKIDRPGEYEVSDVSVQGVNARSHMDEEGKQTATIFKLMAEDIRVAIAGHIYPELSEDQLEAIGMVDVLIVPVGGHGYTLDAIGALKVIKAIDPKIIVPVHYADKGLKYEVPQAELSDALKELGMEVTETVPKLKLKNADLPENKQLYVLERQ